MSSTLNIGALERDGRIVIPRFSIGCSVERLARTAIDAYDRAPTTAQYMHAYNSSAEFRQGIERDMQEWFADFICYGIKPAGRVVPQGFIYAHLVQRPERVYQKKGQIHEPGYGLWAAEGGTRIPVELPPIGIPIPDSDGTLYNPESGLPVLTTTDYARALRELQKIMPREDAEIAADDMFFRYETAPADVTLSPVMRERAFTSRHNNMRSLRLDLSSPDARREDAGYRVVE